MSLRETNITVNMTQAQRDELSERKEGKSFSSYIRSQLFNNNVHNDNNKVNNKIDPVIEGFIKGFDEIFKSVEIPSDAKGVIFEILDRYLEMNDIQEIRGGFK